MPNTVKHDYSKQAKKEITVEDTDSAGILKSRQSKGNVGGGSKTVSVAQLEEVPAEETSSFESEDLSKCESNSD